MRPNLSLINTMHPRMPTARTLRSRPSVCNALLGSRRKQEMIPLPLDFYRLLYVSPVFGTTESVFRAYDRRMKDAAQNVDEYSKKALDARQAVLQGAVNTLTNQSLRRDYDERMRVGDISESIPSEYVPGVLILLQEIGEYSTVIVTGESWLATNRRSSLTKDVARATAMAHLKIAVQVQKQSAQQATGMLEVARDLLKRYNAAPDLRIQITEAIAELEPPLARELLALPLEAEDQRGHGLALVKNILHSLGPTYSECLNGSITAAEAIELYTRCGQSFALTSPQMCNVALAYIADAVNIKCPGQLLKAVAILEAAADAPLPEGLPEIQLQRRAAEERSRRATATAVCKLLLGDSQGAESALGLNAYQPKCDRQIAIFVKSNSPDRSDMLPGMCILAQRWIEDVAIASYRQRAYHGAFNLESWFEDPAVTRQLSLLAEGKFTNGGFVNLVKGVVSWPAFVFRNVFAPLSGPITVDEPEVQLLVHSEKEEVLPAVSEGAHSLLVQQQKLENIVANATSSEEECDEDGDMLTAMLRHKITEISEALPSEVEDLPVVTHSNKRPMVPLTALVTAVMVGTSLAVALHIKPFGTLNERISVPSLPEGIKNILAVQTPVQKVLPTSQQAVALLKKWQRAKAAAMGPSHDIGNLNSVLTGRVLDQWIDRAKGVEAKGWSYSHALESAHITDISASGRKGYITALLTEKVTLNRGEADQGQPHSATNTYKVIYEVVQNEMKEFLICAAEIKL